MPTINHAYTQGGVNSSNLTLTDASDPGGSDKIRIMGAFARDTNVDPNTPGDWTDIAFQDLVNDTSIEFWYSTAASPDLAIDPVATSSKEKGGFVVWLDDYDSGGSIVSTTTYHSSASTTHALGTLTSPGSDFVVIAGYAHGSGKTATFDKNGETDFAEVHDEDIGSAGWHAEDCAVAVWTVTGNTGNYDCEDVVLSSSNDCFTFAISIPISAGGSGVTFNASEGPAVAGGTATTVATGVTFTASEGPAVAGGSSVTVAAGVTFEASEGPTVAGGSTATVVITGGVTFNASEGPAVAGGSTVSVATGVTFASVEGPAVAGGSTATVVITSGVTFEASEGGAVAGGSTPAFVGQTSVLFEAGEGGAVAAGSTALIIVPSTATKVKRRLAGWKNVFRHSDPNLQRTLDSLSEYTAKYGAGATIFKDGSQTLSDATTTKIEFDDVAEDTNNFWNPDNPTRLTVPQKFDGVYVVTAGVRFASNATGFRRAKVLPSWDADGANVEATFRAEPVSSSATAMTVAAPRFYLRAGDYVELEAYQDSGGNLNVSTASTFLSLTRVGDYHVRS